MRILGIETSADETAAAVVEDGSKLLSNVVASSMDQHELYGGIVPEIAARSHIESMIPVIQKALQQAFPDEPGKKWPHIDGIAVTYGPGLGGSLLIGVLTARTLAILKNKPLYPVNHVAAHTYANFLTSTSLPSYALPAKQPEFPLLSLVVSGGHSQLVLFRDYFDYEVLGRTNDDAVGEAFDKVAKILGLPYPGGPSISRQAAKGDPTKYPLPKARMKNKYDFSFSGLKTAVLRAAQKAIGQSFDFPSTNIAEQLTEMQKADLAASFQRAAIEALVDKTLLAYQEYHPASVVIAGGVAANDDLRRQLAGRMPTPVGYTDIKLCTDNAAMIAVYGYFMSRQGQATADPYSLDITVGLSM